MLKTFTSPDPNEVVRVESLIQDVLATKFDYNKPVAFPDPVLKFYSDGRCYPVGGRGMFGAFIGFEKSGKSFVGSEMAVSHLLRGQERLNFELDLDGHFCWIDTEQSDFFYHATQKRIHDFAGIHGNTDIYSAYHLRRWSPAERILAIEEILYTTPNLKGVMVDGLVDLMDSFNDIEQSMRAIQLIMKWTYDLNILLLTVLHANKTTGAARGHAGAFLLQKGDFIIRTLQEKRNEYTISNPTGRFITFPDMTFTRDEATGQAEYVPGKAKFNFI